MQNSLRKQRLYTEKAKDIMSASIIISNCRVRGKITLLRKKLISLRKKLRQNYFKIMSAY